MQRLITLPQHDLEKELIQWKKVAELQKEQVGAASTETTSWRLRFMGERKSMEEVCPLVSVEMVCSRS